MYSIIFLIILNVCLIIFLNGSKKQVKTIKWCFLKLPCFMFLKIENKK